MQLVIWYAPGLYHYYLAIITFVSSFGMIKAIFWDRHDAIKRHMTTPSVPTCIRWPSNTDTTSVARS